MATSRALSLVNSWETTRFELLNTRICDLELRISGSPVEPAIERLYRELTSKKLDFFPKFYLTDGWGCPDEVPVVGIPFYLTDRRLARLEEEQTGALEDEAMTMMLLRHEAGHAINYAYRLWEYDGWTETFGNFTKPYRDSYRPNVLSKEFVRHITHHRYGRTYAQKHPDEDFAETFAVWLAPRSAWRRKYRYWPALAKLKFVDQLMRRLRNRAPLVRNGGLIQPIEELTITLAEHYGQRAERYRADAQGFVDDKLQEVFPETNGRKLITAHELLRRYEDSICLRAAHWSMLERRDVRAIVAKLKDRAAELGLYCKQNEKRDKLMDLTALVTALAMDYAYTGRLTG
ncbi:MAG TPA: hypothetical protein PKD86_08605 [Gemmatales bacterium]|nr:hypothetical protein [Gemmatales bacterium]HMP59399.1 hypothetical protein [Gemmatales bacterium]